HEARRTLDASKEAGNRLAEANARKTLAYALIAHGEPSAAERVIREALALGVPAVFRPGEFHIALGEVLLAQGRAAEALALAREVARENGNTLRTVWLQSTLLQAEALLAASDRAAATAVLAEARAEILAIADRIRDEELRASFLRRGMWTARLLRLAEAE